jgi:hypothetical protein
VNSAIPAAQAARTGFFIVCILLQLNANPQTELASGTVQHFPNKSKLTTCQKFSILHPDSGLFRGHNGNNTRILAMSALKAVPDTEPGSKLGKAKNGFIKTGRFVNRTAGAMSLSFLLALALDVWLFRFCWYESGFSPDPLTGQTILARHMAYLVLYLGGQFMLLTLSKVKELGTATILAMAFFSFVPVFIGGVAIVNHFQGIIKLSWYMPQLVLIWMLASFIDTVVTLAYSFMSDMISGDEI